MLIAALVFAALAALVHVYIFILESVRWTAESTRKTFGIPSLEVAETTKSMAYNQGFYNLFLAIIAGLGVILAIAGNSVVGATLIFAGACSMLLAALVLVTSDHTKLRAGAVQGSFPLLAVVLLGIAAATGALAA
ncbi:DUF1304 domain-containing protein [Pseudoclavibacter sp. RFBJ3]|uniref:DUF1304 domain-containing protein n=1 Tax=unclassified Pseudoclavibacter TaxID=2615177 RepID=UPI000CE775F1|nr:MULTISPECIES: DUF1304 domain-containing protein [unclassified Pseudoclavibacter]PPF86105.1 DUF1304 domain-containing protein [Pseudoclavibacter sp. RFBJ5]PPF92505.1 DUF1304 domain-containing protein [Pseudoclavibacter sp. RFBJ3]PPF97377.1 DUF1304 domain-containing protein [Pseudoclavibacter sp. RFBH5]PPG25040.1 DUF1304 domain-containing protein [Pseudoclavibacter sp. RFBI4]